MNKFYLPLALAFALPLALSLQGCSVISGQNVVIAETEETVNTWTMARRFQAEGRYELAHQYYSLALSAVRTQSALNMLKRELLAVDLQLRAMR